MTWNNRIIRRELKASNGTTELFGLHETYYNSAGAVTMFTQEPMGGYYEDVDELIATLEQQLSDAKKYRDDVIIEKGFVFAPEDGSDAVAIEELQRVMTQDEINSEAKGWEASLREQFGTASGGNGAPVPGPYGGGGTSNKPEAQLQLTHTQVPEPLSQKLFYTQFAKMSEVQIEGLVSRVQAGDLCPLICGGLTVGWICREHRGLLPNLNALVLNQPRPIEAKCPKCQGTEWRYMGCYAIDQFEAHSGFECLGCHHRQYDCFEYRKRPDQSTDGPAGQAQDSGEGSQLGSPS